MFLDLRCHTTFGVVDVVSILEWVKVSYYLLLRFIITKSYIKSRKS